MALKLEKLLCKKSKKCDKISVMKIRGEIEIFNMIEMVRGGGS